MTETRRFWLDTMLSIARPVLEATADGMLAARMPVQQHPAVTNSAEHTYLEALGRTICGVSPWLEQPCEDPAEEHLRVRMAETARAAIINAVDPASPDCMNFSMGAQPIVDAAFLAEGILRAPRELYEKLPETAKGHLVARMKETRTRKPYASNWLLFSAMIEVFLRFAGEPDWDPMRIDYALRQHMQWYVGDGVYGDGPQFHYDYYNSFVIQPMLVDILRHFDDVPGDWAALRPKVCTRAARYASELEQLISPEGTYPVVGRSVSYRYGAFHALAQAALLGMLEPETSPAQVRCAMTAVLRRISAADNTDADGWLTIGVLGTQPRMGETYISTGSLYLCCTSFLPLGLPESSPFWQDPDALWTQAKIWGGEDTAVRHALKD